MQRSIVLSAIFITATLTVSAQAPPAGLDLATIGRGSR